MPKYYCDYCDTYLTHDSPSVRKTHNSGRKHKDNVKFYYTKWMEEQAQHLIDQTIKQAEKSAKTPQAMSGIQPGMPPMPLPPPGVPMPPGIMIPGMMMPPGMPPVPAPGLPPVPPAGVVAAGPDSNTPKSTSASNTAMPPDGQSVRPGLMPMRPGGPLGSMGPGALPPGGPRPMMPGPGGPGNMGSGMPQRNQGQQRAGNMGSQNPPGMQRPHGMSGDNQGLMRPPHMRPPPMSEGMHNGYAPQGGPPHHQGPMPDRPPSYRR